MTVATVRSRAWWVADAVLAAALTVAAVVGLNGLDDAPRAVAYPLVIVHTASLAFRARFPLAVLAAMVATAGLFGPAGVPVVVTGPVILLPMYTVTSRYPPRRSLAALAAAVVALAVQGMDLGGTLSWALILGGAWLLGHYVRTRRLYTAELERRAAELQRAREELADQAVAAERLRIARELHDVVAHAMSVIAVQSGMGAHVIGTQPEEAERALRVIEETSRSGLAELRRLLGVLRDDGDGRAASLSPAPGLADLDTLVAHTTGAGVSVDVNVEGERRPLPPGVDLAAYRIVQEALTNVVKHAGPAARARVTVRYEGRDVRLEVVDDGPPPEPWPPSCNGHGIAGMRERAAVYNGTLEAGPRPGGGFRVAARLPTTASR